MHVEHINPQDTYDSLNTRGYTQVVVASGFQKMVFISGQLPLDENNQFIGQGDIEAQTRACYENLRKSLAAVGADFSNVVRMTTYITDLVEHPKGVRKVRAEYFGTQTPPASTMIEIPRLLNNMLIEVEALAVV
ncbi:MAG: RidA family protein [Pusillimonas sp.]|nr:RidA family protein [Pusillimonas sp.]